MFSFVFSEQQMIDYGWLLFEAERKAKKAKKILLEIKACENSSHVTLEKWKRNN